MEGGHDANENWEARDLRSAVAKVYGDAKDAHQLGLRVALAWAAGLGALAALDMAGMASSASMLWTFACAVAAALLAALTASKSPLPLLLAAALVVVDLVLIAYRLPTTWQNRVPGDMLATTVRVCVAPFVLYAVVTGYLGALSIQAFKKGFSPASDWRTRLNRATIRLIVAGACVAAVGVGGMTWMGAFRAGLADPDVVWEDGKENLFGEWQLPVTAPHVERAEGEVKPQSILDVMRLGSDEDKAPEGPPPVPESARPVFSAKGLDDYAKTELEDAWYWVEDYEADESACVVEALARQDRCRDNRCRFWARFFGRACLVKARKTPKFCDGVPEPTDVAAGTTWAETLCGGRDLATCREAYWAVQGHCHLTREEVEALPPPPPPALPER